MHQSDRAGRRDRTIAPRRKGSSLGRRYCRSSWANAQATLTARSLARCRNPIVSKHVVRLLDYTALANGDRCRRLLSPELSSLDAARRRTNARAQTGSEKPPAGFVRREPSAGATRARRRDWFGQVAARPPARHLAARSRRKRKRVAVPLSPADRRRLTRTGRSRCGRSSSLVAQPARNS
jgi:hypothetical protein